MDNRRGRDNTQDKGGGWLLMGRDPCYPSPPDSRDNPSALLYETQKVATLEGCAVLLATSVRKPLDPIWRCSVTFDISRATIPAAEKEVIIRVYHVLHRVS
jgi:hypothetical protein